MKSHHYILLFMVELVQERLTLLENTRSCIGEPASQISKAASQIRIKMAKHGWRLIMIKTKIETKSPWRNLTGGP